MSPKEVVLAYWQAMQSNDFAKASDWLSQDFECYWPQSKELILGRDKFIALNSSYPAEGKWQFEMRSVVSEGDSVVTEVVVSDGKLNDTAITFHTVKDGLISKQREFWPDPMKAQEWRSQWVEIQSD